MADEDMVTVTLPEKDLVNMLSDITAAHSEYCISSDKCDCYERHDRLDEALKQAGVCET